MKKLKVSIQDEHTLVLQEAGERSDMVDLRSIHETDVNKATVASVASSIKKDVFNRALMKVING